MDAELNHRRLHHGGSSPVITALLLADDRIITTSDDHKIRVFSFEKNSLSYILEGHLGGVWAVDVLGDTLVSGSTDTTVRVWDLKTGKCTHTFKGHEATVRCVKIARPKEAVVRVGGQTTLGQPLIVSGSRDSTLRVWRLPGYDDDDSGTKSNGGETLEVSARLRFVLAISSSYCRLRRTHIIVSFSKGIQQLFAASPSMVVQRYQAATIIPFESGTLRRAR